MNLRNWLPSSSWYGIGFATFVLLIVAVLLVDSLRLRSQASLVPQLVAVPTIVAVLLQIVIDLRKQRRNTRDEALTLDTNNEALAVLDPQKRHTVPRQRGPLTDPQAVLILWSIGVFVTGVVADFFVAIPIALGTIFALTRQSVVLNVAVTAGATALAFVMFVVLLEVRF